MLLRGQSSTFEDRTAEASNWRGFCNKGGTDFIAISEVTEIWHADSFYVNKSSFFFFQARERNRDKRMPGLL